MSSAQLTDDYVAQLLADDAKRSVTRYAAYGLQGNLPKRPTLHAPKPNTRFLRHIIKETDSHNASLHAKESRDAFAKNYDRAGSQSDAKHSHSKSYGKRRRPSADDDGYRYDSRRLKYEEDAIFETADRKERRHRRHARRESKDDEGARQRRKSNRDHSTHGRHSESAKRRRRHIDTSRSLSPRDRDARRDRRRSPVSPFHDLIKSSYHDRSLGDRDSKRKASLSSEPEDQRSSADDSDPLDTIIGPRPPPEDNFKSRGRGLGAAGSRSTMDAHFSHDYDPSADVELAPDLEHDDWDQALEALRDRQKWQQRGAERLRDAGFSEDAVSKWASGKNPGMHVEKDEGEVRWRGKGEGREWDRGKVAASDSE